MTELFVVKNTGAEHLCVGIYGKHVWNKLQTYCDGRLTWWCIYNQTSTDGKRAPLTANDQQPQGNLDHIYRKHVVTIKV